MPTFDISINIYVFLLTIIASLYIGFLQRSRQLAKKQRKIEELEHEMLQAHAELLESQRDYCKLETRIQDITNPVIAMKSNKLEDIPPTPSPERAGIRTNRPTGSD
ncbi:MAG TPA: hypothetical protein VG605_22315 [Puia sp.]|jgi:hypothetical protein|nr:hypothetical protein [Puia sp.]